MKFSIRDLLLVTVIVALAVAWRVDRNRLSRLYEEGRSLRFEAEVKTAVHQKINDVLENQMKEEISKMKGDE